VDNSFEFGRLPCAAFNSFSCDYFIGHRLVNVPSGGVISEARTARDKGRDAIHPDAVYA
jgi:hypothetical protein